MLCTYIQNLGIRKTQDLGPHFSVVPTDCFRESVFWNRDSDIQSTAVTFCHLPLLLVSKPATQFGFNLGLRNGRTKKMLACYRTIHTKGYFVLEGHEGPMVSTQRIVSLHSHLFSQTDMKQTWHEKSISGSQFKKNMRLVAHEIRLIEKKNEYKYIVRKTERKIKLE